MVQELVLSQELPIELTNKNDGQGRHWVGSHRDRNKFEKVIRNLGLIRQPFEFPVEIVVTRLLGPRQRLWDVDSVFRGNWKQIQDSLVACGWLKDDSPKFLKDIRQKQVKDGRDKPAILIEVFKWQ